MAAKKMILVEMPDGSTWAVAAEVVAHDRSNYYRSDGYQDEFDYVMSHDAELKDWAANNMNWDDVKPFARLYRERPQMSADEFQEGWCNGEKKVVATIPAKISDLPIPDCR